jgi:NADH dehydrogenase
MPGTARKLRLILDWTIGLFFGRETAELSRIGHPPSLGGYVETPLRETAEDEASERAPAAVPAESEPPGG